MNYTKESLIKALALPEESEYFGLHFDETMKEYEKNGVPFLTDTFLDELQKQHAVFQKKFDFVKQSAKNVRENDLLARYSLLLYQSLKDKPAGSLVRMPNPPAPPTEALRADYEMAAFFALVAFVPDMIEKLQARNVPADVIAATLLNFEEAILAYETRYLRNGFEVARHFGWIQHYLNLTIIRVGSLNFEMRKQFTDDIVVLKNARKEYKILINNKDIAADGQRADCVGHEATYHADFTETDTYYEGYPVDTDNSVVIPEKIRLPKAEWSVAIRPEDPVLSIHIPLATDLSPAATEAAYAGAFKTVAECFPEFDAKALVCFSWLMDPRMQAMLKPTANITSFQKKFMLYPREGGGQSVFSNLFKKKVDDLHDLPEDTSLQRKVKELYLSGGYIYDQGAVFFFK